MGSIAAGADVVPVSVVGANPATDETDSGCRGEGLAVVDFVGDFGVRIALGHNVPALAVVATAL